MKFIYGPVPSRRLGLSLGISPIPKKTCNFSCIYCQLGRTNKLTNTRQSFFDIDLILKEFETVINHSIKYDVVTIVGEGEPTLYLHLGTLITSLKALTHKPIAVITNGALLYDEEVQEALMHADIVLPTLDAYDELSFKAINRPHGNLNYTSVLEGLKSFSKIYKGQLWIEIMLIKDINDGDEAIEHFRLLLNEISHDKLYLNTPIRPPAEPDVEMVSTDRMNEIAQSLHGISIDLLASEGFFSNIDDDWEAILSIIKRHPMNQFEILNFLESRNCKNPNLLIHRLNSEDQINSLDYKGFITYRLK